MAPCILGERKKLPVGMNGTVSKKPDSRAAKMTALEPHERAGNVSIRKVAMMGLPSCLRSALASLARRNAHGVRHSAEKTVGTSACQTALTADAEVIQQTALFEGQTRSTCPIASEELSSGDRLSSGSPR